MAQRRIHDGAILTAVYILLCLAIITYGRKISLSYGTVWSVPKEEIEFGVWGRVQFDCIQSMLPS